MRYVFPFASITSVNRARAALTKSNIPHCVVELDAAMTKKGCAFGIEVSEIMLDRAERAMKRAGVKVKEAVRL